jgi:hypothetical protein
MDGTNQPAVSRKALWAGWILSAPAVLMLLMSAGMKLARTQQVVEGFSKMGYADSMPVILGAVELACTIIYLIPQTSVLGAILLTGYFGGAVDATVRGGQSIILPVVFGVLIWGGLYLRDPRIRALIPLRTPLK